MRHCHAPGTLRTFAASLSVDGPTRRLPCIRISSLSVLSLLFHFFLACQRGFLLIVRAFYDVPLPTFFSQYSSFLELIHRHLPFLELIHRHLPFLLKLDQNYPPSTMKALDFLAVTVAALSATGVSAISLAPRSSSPNVISLDIERNAVNPLNHDKSRRRKRAGTVSETLENEETLYFANITLGTPAQSLR
jgi:hypothetical protein